ncbi:MAG: class I SAM-dependent methyltransferase [Chloroflexota bacterium]|jgi:SAM-dependent methyltransferase
MANRRWLIPIGVIAGAILYGVIRRGSLKQLTASNMQFSGLSAELYDFLSATFLGDLYDRIAREILVACSKGDLLDVGCGPGHLACRLAMAGPDLRITGIDISPAMIELAARHAEEAGLGERLRFQLGDVESLPFPDEQFDLVVSTLSLHHWQHPSKGLQEIFRVLKPGGQARILDLPDWVRQNIHGYGDGRGLAQLAAASPFGRGVVAVFRWPGRLPTMRCLWLRREG